MADMDLMPRIVAPLAPSQDICEGAAPVSGLDVCLPEAGLLDELSDDLSARSGAVPEFGWDFVSGNSCTAPAICLPWLVAIGWSTGNARGGRLS